MKILKYLLPFTFLFLFALEASADVKSVMGATKGGIDAFFANGTLSFEALISLIKKCTYLIGTFIIIAAIFKFTQLGDGQGRVTAKTPIIMFISGIALFALTGSLSIVAQSMSMGNGPGDFLMPGAASNSATTAVMKGVLTFITLIGYIAFIRGWLMFNQAANGKEGMVFRGATHIIGGVAAINIAWTAKILANTFAPGMDISVFGL